MNLRGALRTPDAKVLCPAWAAYSRPASIFGVAVLTFGLAGMTSSSRLEHGQPAGMIAGTVELDVVGEADPPMTSPYARRRYRPPTPSPAAPGSPVNVVVYVLVDEESRPPARDTSVAIVQRDLAIVPHVTAVPVGTRVEFPNEDDVYHNLFSLSDTRRFNLGRYPPGQSRSEQFPDAGVVRMFCDIHSGMGGVILVVDTPLIGRPDGTGQYRIGGVPAGRHRVVAWHETAGADTVEVVVVQGVTARVNFRLSR